MSNEHDGHERPPQHAGAADDGRPKKGFWKRLFSRAPEGESPEERAERLQATVDELADTLTQHENRQNVLEFELASNRVRIETITTERDALLAERTRATQQRDEVTSERDGKTQELAELRDLYAAEQKARGEIERQLSIAQRDLRNQSAQQQQFQLAGKRATVASAKARSLENEVARLEQSMVTITGERDQVRTAHKALAERVAMMQRQVDAMVAERDAARRDLTRTEDELESVRSQVATASAGAQRAQQASARVTALEAEAERVATELGQLRIELAAARADQQRHDRLARVAAWLTSSMQASFVDWFGDGSSLAWRRWAEVAADAGAAPPLTIEELAEVARALGTADAVELERDGSQGARLRIAGGDTAAEHPWSYDFIAALARIATGKPVASRSNGRDEDGAHVVSLQ